MRGRVSRRYPNRLLHRRQPITSFRICVFGSFKSCSSDCSSDCSFPRAVLPSSLLNGVGRARSGNIPRGRDKSTTVMLQSRAVKSDTHACFLERGVTVSATRITLFHCSRSLRPIRRIVSRCQFRRLHHLRRCTAVTFM